MSTCLPFTMPLNGGGGSCFAFILASKHTVVACSDCDWMSNVARSLVMRRPSCVLTKSICNQKHNIDFTARPLLVQRLQVSAHAMHTLPSF